MRPFAQAQRALGTSSASWARRRRAGQRSRRRPAQRSRSRPTTCVARRSGALSPPGQAVEQHAELVFQPADLAQVFGRPPARTPAACVPSWPSPRATPPRCARAARASRSASSTRRSTSSLLLTRIAFMPPPWPLAAGQPSAIAVSARMPAAPARQSSAATPHSSPRPGRGRPRPRPGCCRGWPATRRERPGSRSISRRAAPRPPRGGRRRRSLRMDRDAGAGLQQAPERRVATAGHGAARRRARRPAARHPASASAAAGWDDRAGAQRARSRAASESCRWGRGREASRRRLAGSPPAIRGRAWRRRGRQPRRGWFRMHRRSRRLYPTRSAAQASPPGPAVSTARRKACCGQRRVAGLLGVDAALGRDRRAGAAE